MDTSLVAALVRDALRSAGKSRDRGRLRASDSEREQVIGALQAAFVQGRLTQDEHDARAAHGRGQHRCGILVR